MGNVKHGLYKLKKSLVLRGWAALDGRSQGAKQLFSWRSELLASLGGDSITPQRKAIVESCCRTRLFLDAIDLWLLSLKSLVNGRKKSLLPAVTQRQSLADSLLRQLTTLGLERVPACIPDLKDYIRRFDSGKASQDGQETSGNGNSSDGRAEGRAEGSQA